LIDLAPPIQYDDDDGCILSKDKPNMISLSRSKVRKTEKGQSFLELTLVVVFLMIFVAGVIEFGFLLNNYLNLVDASREAVRYSSDFDPFLPGCEDHSDPSCRDPNFFTQTYQLTQDVLAPVVLDATKGDDVVISFFSVGSGIYIRYPDDRVGRLTVIRYQLTNANSEPSGVFCTCRGFIS
jgi:hypothetical protein